MMGAKMLLNGLLVTNKTVVDESWKKILKSGMK